MQVPLEITYRDVEKTDEVERLVREKAGKLDELCGNLIACRVAIDLTDDKLVDELSGNVQFSGVPATVEPLPPT